MTHEVHLDPRLARRQRRPQRPVASGDRREERAEELLVAKLLLVLVAHELLGQEEQVVLDLVVDARLQRDLEQADLAGDDGLVPADERRLVVRP